MDELTDSNPQLNGETEVRIKLSAKQREAYAILQDKTTEELVYGGGAGGAKSYLGCVWVILMCLTFAGIRAVIGREELKSLKDSTLLTFFEICGKWGLREGSDYTYNETKGTIIFHATRSVVFLRELSWLPKDPNYDRLGSTEYTIGFIDEAQQVRQKAKEVLISRLRYKIHVNGLVPKLLMTCNPSKGWLYTEFYLPFKKGELVPGKRFLRALLLDNPFRDPTYEANLRRRDKQTQERLLRGNWEYDDDPNALVNQDSLVDLFTNTVLGSRNRTQDELDSGIHPFKSYIIVDVARFGNDRTVFSYWEGMACKRIAAFTKLPLVPNPHWKTPMEFPSVAGKLIQWREQYEVPLSRCLADEDGVGGGVVDYTGCRGFMGGRKPLPEKGIIRNYLNLRSQCYYKLADAINTASIAVPSASPTIRDLIMEEVEQIKAKDPDKDRKLAIVSKEDIKDVLGRSPDFADNLMMRMYFEFAPRPSIVHIGG